MKRLIKEVFNFRDKMKFLNLSCFLIAIILLERLLLQFREGFKKESWNISEFLINYEGGFVRRGFLGELILILNQKFGLSPYYFIIGISLISFSILILFLFKKFKENGLSIFLLLTVVLLGNPILNNFVIRKDIILLLIFILCLKIYSKNIRYSFIWINFFLIISILIHEASFFFSVGIFYLLFFKREKQNNFFVKSCFSFFKLSPIIVVFILVSLNKGNSIISSEIWDSWSKVHFPFQENNNEYPPAAIGAISLSLKQGLYYSKSLLYNFNDGIYAPIAWVLIILMTYFVLTNLKEFTIRKISNNYFYALNKTSISSILLFQLIVLIPLFILGWDYSRWLFYWVISSLSIIFLIKSNDLHSIFSTSFISLVVKFNFILSRIFF